MNITDPIGETARTRPDLVAIIRANDACITYGALDCYIDHFGRRVLALGLRPGQIVGLSIVGPDEALTLILALALARLGVATAEMDLPPHHLSAAFLQPGHRAPVGVPAFTLDHTWFGVSGRRPEAVSAHQDGAAILRILSTSGTIGVARYCPVAHEQMAARVAGHGFPMVSPDWPTVLICAMGLGGAPGLRAFFTTFAAAGTMVLTNPTSLANAVLRHRVTALAISPNTLQSIVATIPPGIGPLPHLRALKVSGSHLPPTLARVAAERLCANIVTSFGTTETGNICAGRHDDITVPLGVGRIVDRVEVEAVGDDGTPLPAGQEGRLRFRTAGMITGYFDDEAATGGAFCDGWFYSGDLGAVSAERVLIVTGRTGEFINSGGVKVSPRVIEDVLMTLPEITEAAAFAVPDPDGLAQIWAAIVADRPIETAVLNRLCTEALGPRAPKFILHMKDLPRNANGKVRTNEIIEFVIGLRRQSKTSP